MAAKPDELNPDPIGSPNQITELLTTAKSYIHLPFPNVINEVPHMLTKAFELQADAADVDEAISKAEIVHSINTLWIELAKANFDYSYAAANAILINCRVLLQQEQDPLEVNVLRIRLDRSIALHMLGRFSDALDAYSELIGEIEALKKVRKAKQEKVKSLIELNRIWAAARYGRADVYNLLGVSGMEDSLIDLGKLTKMAENALGSDKKADYPEFYNYLIDSLYNSARNYERLGELTESVADYEDLLGTLDEFGDTTMEFYIKIHVKLIELHFQMRFFERAQGVCDKLLDLDSPETPLPIDVKFFAMSMRAQIYFWQEVYLVSEFQFNQALDLIEAEEQMVLGEQCDWMRENFTDWLATVKRNLGLSLYENGKFIASLDLLVGLVYDIEQHTRVDFQTEGDIKVALAYAALGGGNKEIISYSLEVLEELAVPEKLMRLGTNLQLLVLCNLGDGYFVLGDYKLALKRYRSAIAIINSYEGEDPNSDIGEYAGSQILQCSNAIANGGKPDHDSSDDDDLNKVGAN